MFDDLTTVGKHQTVLTIESIIYVDLYYFTHRSFGVIWKIPNIMNGKVSNQ